MVNVTRYCDVESALGDVREVLSTIHFALPTMHAELGGEMLNDVIHQLDDYLLPRYQNMDAPILGVIGGSTGSGKSSLINSLVREHVALTSPVRPTTRQPMLIFNPADEQWFTDNRILPGLTRISGTAAQEDGHQFLSLHASEAVSQGLLLLIHQILIR